MSRALEAPDDPQQSRYVGASEATSKDMLTLVYRGSSSDTLRSSVCVSHEIIQVTDYASCHHSDMITSMCLPAWWVVANVSPA